MNMEILKDKEIKKVLKFGENMFVLKTKDINKDDNNTWYFLCELNKTDFNMYSTTMMHNTIKELIDNKTICIVSSIIVHRIDEELEARHFIYSDYRGLTNRACDTYFEVYSIYTEKEYRHKNLTKEFVDVVLTNLYKDERYLEHETCIFAQVGISSLEYDQEAYENLTDKERDKLINDSISFCKKCGFVNVNKLSDFEESCNMYFIPDFAARSLISFFNRALENKQKELLKMHKDLTAEKRNNNESK